MPPAVCGRNGVGFLKLFFFSYCISKRFLWWCLLCSCYYFNIGSVFNWRLQSYKLTDQTLQRKRASSSDSKLTLEKSHSWEILLICIFTCWKRSNTRPQLIANIPMEPKLGGWVPVGDIFFLICLLVGEFHFSLSFSENPILKFKFRRFKVWLCWHWRNDRLMM